MGDLTSLIARVQALTGPDREVDREIAINFCEPWDYGASWTGWGYGEDGRPIEKPVAFRYTGSIDATVALTERVLPGVSWNLHWRGIGKNCDGWIQRLDGDSREITHQYEWSGIEVPTPAIALILATLKALQARELCNGED